MLCCRFRVKVTALWEEGSNADVALDDIAVGAACFIRGKLLALCHYPFLQKRKAISALHFSSKLIENEMYFTWKSVRWCINEGWDEKNECILSMCSKTLVAFLVNSITFTNPVHLSDKIWVIAPKISWYLKGKTNLFLETVKVPKSEFLYQADDVKGTEWISMCENINPV